MTKIRGILFDMDGVLIDAKEWHYEAFNRALRLFGHEITRYDHLNSFDGLPTKDKLHMISHEAYLPESLHGFINQLKQDYTKEMIETKCKPVFQHEYALAKLKKEGYRMAVCSNSIRDTIENMMRKAALIDYLEFIMSNEDVEHSKPSPEIYIKAMKKMNLKPDECLILEDNKNGIKAAVASSAHLLRVNDVFDVNYSNIISMIKKIEGGYK
jgi:HAD superfamily hydrolase (TIGR01509 family)